MTTTTHDLEHLLDTVDNHPPVCGVPFAHDCTHIARWALYRGPHCVRPGQPHGRVLICDAWKTARDKLINEGRDCACGKPFGHNPCIPL